MNYRGSYRHLLKNAQAAMLAAIEIYNKPGLLYRDELVVILLVNAWELALKALLSKNGRSLYYPKARNEPYKTVTWQDAMTRAEPFFPKELSVLPIRRNLDLLTTFRNNAIHFYNSPGFRTLIYALAQTCVLNFRDFLLQTFKVDVGGQITWILLPLGIEPPLDPVDYIAGQGKKQAKGDAAVRQFFAELSRAQADVERAGEDTGRLLTRFTVKLESTKKLAKADVVVGVVKADESQGPLTIERPMDPNKTHPLRQKELLAQIPALHGKRFTSYQFQALVWKNSLKGNRQYCWEATEGVLVRYSHDVVSWIKRLSPGDVQAALADYRTHLRRK
jgi:hypothetical protein